jgi:hypothetical protein
LRVIEFLRRQVACVALCHLLATISVTVGRLLIVEDGDAPGRVWKTAA